MLNPLGYLNRIRPASLLETYKVRWQRPLQLLGILAVALVLAGICEQVGFPLGFLFLIPSYALLFFFAIGALRYLGFLWRFRLYLDEYIAGQINGQTDTGAHLAQPVGVFAELARTEKIDWTLVAIGKVNGRRVRYIRCFAQFYPERGRNSTYKNYHIFQIELAKASTHVYIDSKANNPKVPVPTAMQILRSCINHNQLLTLEGDFSTHFNVYGHKDAKFLPLTTLDPNTMLQLQNLTQDFDIEFCGNRVLLICARMGYSADMLMNRLQSVVDTLEHLPHSTGLYTANDVPLAVRRPPVALL